MKKYFIISIGLLVAIILAGCEGDNGTSGASNEKDLGNVDVMLDWYPNAVHSFLYVALEKGYFEEEGIKVTIKFPANPTDPLNLAAASKVTLGLYYQPDVIMARANEGIPVKSTGAIVRSPLNHLVFKENSPIKTPKDLEGKKVGYPGIPINEAIVRTMVEHDGGNIDDVEMKDVGFELGTALIADKVDAVAGAYVNHEVPVLESKGYDVEYTNPTDYGVPSYYELVAVTSDKTWNEQQDEIEAFWRGAAKGYEYMKENPEDALQILLDNQDEANFPLDKEVEAKSMEILIPKMESDEGFGSQEEQSWQETAEWLKEVGIIEEIPDMDDIFVNK
ncbi:ABC transporter substrate-binding protein [Virgibacillus sp. SK37]|uniref:ABC transporter substrate-binding protein n=1 Tax=Virgibacillus sp. SK37 TaxID=403957 RepID=UPI0004D12E01|nr:ABC transporter substrate-binding protein [Virgibacillus sp. SK37]AIF42776.1 ABC transporter substrate-binding protein [Virgibacillus sp. SK37]